MLQIGDQFDEDRYPDMHALTEALDHPETADLTLLDQVNAPAAALSFWHSTAVKVIAVSVLILLALAALAFILQSFRP
jgi:hypothetical protein